MFNWEEYWSQHKETPEAHKFNLWLANEISKLIIKNSYIKSVADYGCGPATTIFKLANDFPNIGFFGFDISPTIVAANNIKARRLGLENINFIACSLPNTAARRCFDLILCISTLHYIADIIRAIRNLYENLNLNGYLLFNYPNIYTRAWYTKNIKHEDEEMAKRFKLVLNGVNIVSIRKMRELLGVKPRKFYSSKRENIYVLVKKTE
jgi:SAM-dependent methyltransferase